MSEPSLLHVEEMYFPVLELRTLNTHNNSGERSGTIVKFGRNVQKLDARPGKYALAMSVATNDEESRNAPYKFHVEAFAVVSITGTPLEGEAATKFIENAGAPILMGAIREKVSELTAGAPFGRFLLKPIPLGEPMEIRII